MAYINPKLDYKEGDILYGSDLNASNLVIKKGVDDNYDKIKDIEVFNTELDTDITNLEVALEENVTTLEKSIADNVTILEKSIDDNLKKIEAVERFTTNLESDINTLASGATPIATKHTRGFVQVGDNLNVDSNGVISGKDPYVLPIATDNVIGGVSIGANIDTDGKGKISVKGVKGSNNISVVEQDGNYHIAYTGENFKKEIVEELPPVGKDDVIYLLKKDTASGSDIYDEYLWIDGVWNPIGSTDVDLSNYYDKATVDEKLDAKADKGDVGGKEVFVSSTQPSDTSMQIWIDESEDGSTFDPTSFYKKEETDELLEELDTTLTEYVDTAISELDLDLPIATSDVLGGIKVGDNLTIDENGVLSASVNDDSNKVIYSDGTLYIEDLDKDRVHAITGDWNISRNTSNKLYCGGNTYIGYFDKPYDSTRFYGITLGAMGMEVIEILNLGTSDIVMTGHFNEPVDNLTTETSMSPLSAGQGKVLKGLIDTLQTQVDNINPELPIATSDVLGGIKVGDNLTIDETGILSGLASGIMVITEDVVKQLNMDYYGSTTSRNFYPVTVALKYGCGIYKIDVDANLYTAQNVSRGSISKGDIMIVFNKGKDILFFVSPVTASHYSAIIALHTTSTISASITYTMYSTNNSDMATWFTKFTTLNKALTIDNTTSFTPYNNYNPVHKKYVDDAINNLQTQINNLPTGSSETVLYESPINEESAMLSESFENFSEIDVYLHNEDKTIEEKVTIVNPRQSYLAYEKVISHVDLGVFYMLEYLINYDSTTTLSVTGNTGKSIDDTVTTVTSADMPTLYIGKVVGR